MQRNLTTARNIEKLDSKIKKANQKYNEKEYAVAYGLYLAAWNIANKLRAKETLYCEVGMFQCQHMLGILPLRTLISVSQRLSDELQQAPEQLGWAKDCRSALTTLQRQLEEPLFQAHYAYVSTVKIQKELEKETLSTTLQMFERGSMNEYLKKNYLLEVIVGLEIACDIYQQHDQIEEKKNVLDLMAILYEAIADSYMEILDDRCLQLGWAEDDYDGYEPLASLNAAMNYYDKAISTWKELGTLPSFDLLFSTVYVAWVAESFLDLRDYLRLFDIEKVLNKYSLEEAIGKIENDEERGKRIEELEKYDGFRQKMRDQKLKKNERPKDTVVQERPLKTARTSLEQYSVFPPPLKKEELDTVTLLMTGLPHPSDSQ